jgi:hypothetical protein
MFDFKANLKFEKIKKAKFEELREDRKEADGETIMRITDA